MCFLFFFFFKQKTAYEMRISDWSSDVCSSDLWGSFEWVGVPGVKDPWINQDPGWVDGFGFDEEGAMIDPRKRDGLYVGPSRGHVDDEKADKVGLARDYRSEERRVGKEGGSTGRSRWAA